LPDPEQISNSITGFTIVIADPSQKKLSINTDYYFTKNARRYVAYKTPIGKTLDHLTPGYEHNCYIIAEEIIKDIIRFIANLL
jgi:predicted porin